MYADYTSPIVGDSAELPTLSIFWSSIVRENSYQAHLKKKLELMYPSSVVLKNDPNFRQGIPDLVIFYGDRWAMLEVKAHENAPEQPNQRYYIEKLNHMSFAAIIFPENEEEVLDGLQRSFNN